MPVLEYIPTPRQLNDWWTPYKRNITSQCGEDGVLEKIFELIEPENRWCAEFGAWDGKHFSNTYPLLADKGWSGLLLEANAERYRQLCRTHAGRVRCICLNAVVGFDGAGTFDSVAEAHGVPENLDLLCVDIDGCDYHVWRSITRFRPNVVVIEFNPSIGNDIVFIQDVDMSINHGCSLRALIRLAAEKGYELVAVTGWNAIFTRAEYLPRFRLPDNSIDKMHDPSPYETKLFQLYDGTLKTVGNRLLHWHGVEFSDDDIQVLPERERCFPDRLK